MNGLVLKSLLLWFQASDVHYVTSSKHRPPLLEKKR